MTTSNKPSTTFWVIGVIALIWNLLGVLAYLGQAYMTDEIKATLPQDQLDILEATPAWATAAFAIAVWGGFLGAILLLMRKKLAHYVFTISLLGILVQLTYNLFLTNAMDAYGPGGLIMPILTVSFALFIIWHSKKCVSDGLLS